MVDSGSVLTAASIIAGFGVTVLMFRLQRELQISDKNWESLERERMPTWIPPADYLVISAVLISLLFGVLPLLVTEVDPKQSPRLSVASCAAATVLLAGYIPSILAHYRFIYGLHKPRPYFLWWELFFVTLTIIGALVVFHWSLD